MNGELATNLSRGDRQAAVLHVVRVEVRSDRGPRYAQKGGWLEYSCECSSAVSHLQLIQRDVDPALAADAGPVT